MKGFFLVAVILLALSGVASQASAVQFECTLAMEVFPLEYSFVTRAVSARIRFTSNCLRLRDFVFEGFFNFHRRINRRRHPVTINLSVFRNRYALTYRSPATIERNTIMRRFQYSRATLTPGQGGAAVPINVLQDNRVILAEQRPNSINFNRLRRMLRRRNPVACRVHKNLRQMNCRI